MAAKGKNTAAGKLHKSYFDVLGLCCSSEVPLIENILKSLVGVKEITVIVPSRTVIVVHDNLLVSPNQIVKALNQARLEANIRVQGEENLKQKWPSPFSVVCGVLLLLSLLKYAWHPLRYLALGAVVAGIFPIAWKALIAIKNFRIDINILALVAVIGTVAIGDYFEAATIVFLFSIAEWLESRASHKANAAMSSLMSLAPQRAVIAGTGEVVDADEVKLNTVLAVKAGEVIPIDGIVVEGNCEVDEKTLTGESFPVAKQQDSTVWAGTINLNGYISVKTTALAEDCVVAKMAKMVEQAQNNKSKAQRFIDKCAKFYTPAVVVIAASLVLIPVALRAHNLNHWFHFALVVLVSACPCALVLSTPVVTFCALTKAAKSGLLIKGGEYLEILAKIKNMAFDKTGTITSGEFIVTDFQSLCDDINKNTLVYWVSSVESKSSHPMAAALVDYGRSLYIEPKPEDVEDFQNFPGEGIYGRINGKDIYIGNKRIAGKAGSETVPVPDSDAMDGRTIGYIYLGRKPAGFFSLSDACRTGVAEAIKELKSLGIKTAMLTGDSQSAAMQAQSQLGNALDIVRAELLPEDKAKIIKEFKAEGTTAMIGDGLNDAPALATADVGISMGISGSALATETGHMILMSNDIRKIAISIRLARKARRKIIENVVLSIGTKGAILGLAVAGHPLVWAAVLADMGTCLLVITNGMLLLGRKEKPKSKCCRSSAASHNHNHGCGSHKSHSAETTSHHCCDKNKCKDQENDKPQKCCSPNSGQLSSTHCEGHNCTDSVEEGNDPQCCKEDNYNVKCCEENHCERGTREVMHNHTCNPRSCQNDFETKDCNIGSHSTGEQSSHSSGKCHAADGVIGRRDHLHCKTKCDPDRSSHHHTTIDIKSANEIVESTCFHACRNLKGEMGGCCKSYMKEYCRKHGHLGCGFEGVGLTEIVTE